jgi:hypothetical protein
MKGKLYHIGLLLFLATSSLQAQVKYSNEFLNIGVGVRSAGMGNAVVASTTDVTAGYWNTAGLLNLENNLEIGLMHSELFAGIATHDYGSVGFKIDEVSAGGVSFIRSGVDDIPDTRNLVDANGNFNYNKIESFSSVDNAFIFHYARKLGPEALTVGANVKLIYRKVGEFANAFGFGIDISGMYDLGKVKLAASFRDITGTYSAWNFNTEELEDVFVLTGNEVPTNSIEITAPQAVLGGGYTYQINEKFGLYPELNLAVTFDGERNTLIRSSLLSIDPRVGLEGNYNEIFFIRLGINGFQKELTIDDDTKWSSSPAIGVGVKFNKVALDYALTNIGGGTGFYTNSFFIKIGINKRK